MTKPVNSTVHFAAKALGPVGLVTQAISQTSVCQYVAKTKVFQFLNAKVGRAAGSFLVGVTVEVVAATKGGQIGATVGGGLAQAAFPLPGAEYVGAVAGRVLGTAVGGYLVAKNMRNSEQPFTSYLQDTTVYLGAGQAVGMLTGTPSGALVRFAAAGGALVSAKAAYNAQSKEARLSYSALFIASSGLVLSPGVAQTVEMGLRNTTYGSLALNAELINEIRKADLQSVATFGIKTITEEGLQGLSEALVQGTLPDPNLFMERVITPIMTAATPLLIKKAILSIRLEFALVMSAARTFAPLLKIPRVVDAYKVLEQYCKDEDATDAEKQSLSMEFNMVLREALGLPNQVPDEGIAIAIVTKIFTQLETLEEHFGPSMAKALIIGACALVNTSPDTLASYAKDGVKALESGMNDGIAALTSSQEATGALQTISREMASQLGKASLQSLVVRAVKMVTGDDMQAYAAGLASGVAPNTNNFFSRAVATLMNKTTAPLIQRAIYWVIQEPTYIANALMHAMNAFAPLLDKPKVKAAYENLYKTFTDEAATEKDKKTAAKAFTSALKKAVRAKYHSLEASRLLFIDKIDPAALVAKNLAKNIVGQLDILEETLGAPIAQAIASDGYKVFLEQYLSITLKYYIMTLVTNYFKFGPTPLTHEEGCQFVQNAAEYAVFKTQALPAPVAAMAKSALDKGVKVMRGQSNEMPPEMMPQASQKANFLFLFAFGSYKVMEAAIQETFSFVVGKVKSLQRRVTRFLSRIARAAQSILYVNSKKINRMDAIAAVAG